MHCPTGNTAQNLSTWRVTTMSSENWTLLCEVILYYRSAANIFSTCLQWDWARDSWGVSRTGPALQGPCCPCPASPRGGGRRDNGDAQGSWDQDSHPHTLHGQCLTLLPKVLSVERYGPWDPPWKVASWSNTPRALASYKVLMGLVRRAAVVWKPCPHHSFCFVFSQYHLVFFLFWTFWRTHTLKPYWRYWYLWLKSIS